MRKLLIIRRKNIIVGLLVILLIITGYLNFRFNQNAAPAVNPKDNKTSEADTDENPQTGSHGNKGQGEVDENYLTSGGKITVTDLDESPGEESSQAASSSAAFFRDYRFERKQNRSKEVEYINSVINNPNSDPEMIKEAQMQLLEITESMEAEMSIENLIKAKGFRDAIVIIHRDNVNVIVDKAELVPEEVAMILDIVRRESGKEVENIKIIPKI